jgi:phosphatidylserine/phosphatidylglycerophosphate/cardiolipin synthase-like enzyme
VFDALSSRDLAHLATVFAQHKVEWPCFEAALQRAGLARTGVLDGLESLARDHFTIDQTAQLFRLLANERERVERPTPQIELVASGADAKTPVRDTSVVMNQLFATAKGRILIVGFAIYDGHDIFKTLATRFDQEDQLKIICCFDITRTNEDHSSDSEIISRFAHRFAKYQWPGKRLPEVYYDARSLSRDRNSRAVLHAKTVVIDSAKAIVTSANPTPAAYLRNIELGVLISGGTIPADIDQYFMRLISSNRLDPLRMPI